MKLAPRMAFRCMEPPRHIHVPIFDPQRDNDEMLLVNFTPCATPALTTPVSTTRRTIRTLPVQVGRHGD